MADKATAERAQANGHAPVNGAGPQGAVAGSRGLIGSLVGAGRGAVEAGAGLANQAVSQVLAPLATTLVERMGADLDDRDPDYIRERLPQLWLAASIWFRGEVRNLANIPEDRAVLLVGNHSGGNLTPDTTVLSLAFSTYFGVERPFYQLAHNLVLASPAGPFLKKFGTVTASHENAQKALRSGAVLLVYPGGDWEVHRPSWERNKIDFNGRKGFIRLALNEGVPIVPVVSVGGQETSLFLSHGSRLAQLLRVDRSLRLKVLPISLAIPWGLNVGDFFGHLPLPAKITIDVLPAIELRERFGPDPDVDLVYEQVTTMMQDGLDSLAAERRFPVIG